MNKTIIIQKDYSTYSGEYQLKIESETEILIRVDDSVRLLNEVLEGLDYQALHRTYSPKGRKPKTPPKTLFKILVYGNMDRTYSSRELEKACRRDVNYMWLLGGEEAPNHNEIARFRSKRLPHAAEDLFYQLVKGLRSVDEVKFEHLFVDGTKIEANANKYSFVWKKSTTKHQARLNGKISKFIGEINLKYETNYADEGCLEEIMAYLKDKVKAPFVYGRGKRKEEIQREVETLTDYIRRSEKYAKYQDIFEGRNSFSKTDPDATFMRMKDDHMRNAQLKPGYNLQLAVEGEYVTGVDISSERSDQLTMIPFIERMEQNGVKYEDVTLDAGYESEENYTYFEKKQQTCYIKPQNYERSKTRKFKSNMNLRENMPYDAEKDEYTCQNGKKFKAVALSKRKSTTGFESEITHYECEHCEGCPHKSSCTKAKGNRKIQVSKEFLRQRAGSLQKITSEKGILLRTNRSIQVEGAFGVIKQDYGFRQFLLRGNKKVFTEVLLMVIGYNINKLHHKIQDNRTGSQLFQKNAA